MPSNVTNWAREAWTVIYGSLILFALALALLQRRRRAGVRSAAAGRRPEGEQPSGERVRPDQYIDSFAGLVEEAGGKLPLALTAVVIVTLVAWAGYMIVNWRPW